MKALKRLANSLAKSAIGEALVCTPKRKTEPLTWRRVIHARYSEPRERDWSMEEVGGPALRLATRPRAGGRGFGAKGRARTIRKERRRLRTQVLVREGGGEEPVRFAQSHGATRPLGWIEARVRYEKRTVPTEGCGFQLPVNSRPIEPFTGDDAWREGTSPAATAAASLAALEDEMLALGFKPRRSL